jgi:hypothetical protein
MIDTAKRKQITGGDARKTAEARRQGMEIAGANLEKGEYFGGTACRVHRGPAPSWKRQGRRPKGRRARHDEREHS